MAPEKDDTVYLWDMLDAAKAVVGFVASRSYQEYEGDRMLRGAVERHIEIIGEAARRVSLSFQAAHDEIPWRSIIGLRNVLAHDYGEIMDDKMWVLATRSIPELVKALEPLVPPQPPEELG